MSMNKVLRAYHSHKASRLLRAGLLAPKLRAALAPEQAILLHSLIDAMDATLDEIEDPAGY